MLTYQSVMGKGFLEGTSKSSMAFFTVQAFQLLHSVWESAFLNCLQAILSKGLGPAGSGLGLGFKSLFSSLGRLWSTSMRIGNEVLRLMVYGSFPVKESQENCTQTYNLSLIWTEATRAPFQPTRERRYKIGPNPNLKVLSVCSPRKKL